jgi:hypothetical protein
MLAQVDYIPDSLLTSAESPWWSRSIYHDQSILVGGVSLPAIVERLKLVYDEAACQDMVLRGYWAPLAGLLSGSPMLEWFGVMIGLGADLHELSNDEVASLAPRLRSGEQWMGARLEAGVGAGLHRCGLQPVRAQLAKHLKQWDYTVVLDGVPFLIECKALSSGDDDGNFDQLEQRYQALIVEFGMEPPCDATLHLSSDMVTEIQTRKTQLFHECVLPEFTEELRRTFRRSRLDGTPRHVGRFGLLTLMPSVRDDGFLGRWVVAGYESTPIHRFRRVANTFADATRNFDNAPSAHRVVVVWTGREYVRADMSSLAMSNLDRIIEVDGVRVDLSRSRFGFETGVAIDSHHRVIGTGFKMESGQFRARDYRSLLPRAIYSGLRCWSYHVTLDGRGD